jgi:hypothetical protein
MRRMQTERMIGHPVTIRSTAGIEYRGVVRSIRHDLGYGELFELGSLVDPGYQRFVYVLSRRSQIRDLAVHSGEAHQVP